MASEFCLVKEQYLLRLHCDVFSVAKGDLHHHLFLCAPGTGQGLGSQGWIALPEEVEKSHDSIAPGKKHRGTNGKKDIGDRVEISPRLLGDRIQRENMYRKEITEAKITENPLWKSETHCIFNCSLATWFPQYLIKFC